MQIFDVLIVGAGPAGIASALKCAQEGLNVLVIEKDEYGRSKPCGGVIPPVCLEILDCELKLEMPTSVFSSSRTLGLFYVPPSGRENGGFVKNYRLLNVNRALFDKWLCSIAKERNIPILFNTEFLSFQKDEKHIEVLAKANGGVLKFKAYYLVGADGSFSKVRKQIYPGVTSFTAILQEYWAAKGDFQDFFYMILKENITPTYGYVIPKDGLFIIGTGATKGNMEALQLHLNKFKKWLSEEFSFKPLSLKKREIGFIPHGVTVTGRENLILVGDAGGFCNPFSGEGIRLAIESGIIAGNSVKQAKASGKDLAVVYQQSIRSLEEFISKVKEFALNLNDEEREKFVKSELARYF